MIIRVENNDTSFFYKSDWEYKKFETNPNQLSDSAEAFATFFMTLDNAVFGHRNFKILDTNLFRTEHGRADKVRFDSLQLVESNNLLIAVEFCTAVAVSFNMCPNLPGHCIGAGGACDHCYSVCTGVSQVDICWTGLVETGNGGGNDGGGSGGGGGIGGSGGTPTPPCGGPSGRGNAPCNPGGGGGGWTPLPIEDEEPLSPIIFLDLDYSQISNGCLEDIISFIGVNGHNSAIFRIFQTQNITVGGTQKKISAKYYQNSTLANANGQTIPASSEIVPLGNETYELAITLNPTQFVNTTKEWAASVILHEMLHGMLTLYRPDLVTTKAQHINMYNSGLPLAVANSLRELFPTLDVYKAIALSVAPLTDAYWNPITNSYIPGAEAKCIELYFQTLGEVITQYDSFKNAVTNTGTPFCF
jgi:hypothetical protein